MLARSGAAALACISAVGIRELGCDAKCSKGSRAKKDWPDAAYARFKRSLSRPGTYIAHGGSASCIYLLISAVHTSFCFTSRKTRSDKADQGGDAACISLDSKTVTWKSAR